MGFILTLLVVSLIVAALFYVNDEEAGKVALVVCGVVSAIIVGLFIIFSTFSYYGLHERLGKHEVYQQAVKVYIAKATPAIGAGPNTSVSGNEITDFKYQSYQRELSELLKYTRYNAAAFNETLAGKRAMARSWYWRAIIVEPDEWMKPLTIE